jgi:HSP20 family protein
MRKNFPPGTVTPAPILLTRSPPRTLNAEINAACGAAIAGIERAKHGAVKNTRSAGSANHQPQFVHIMRIVRYNYPNYRSPVLGRFSPSPWSGLENEIDRLFETALTSFADSTAASRFAVDLYEDKDNAYVRAELPGVTRDEINVEMVEDYLTISGSRKTPAKDGQAEQSFSFSRSVNIPEEVDAEKVSATYENGVLTVTLPKREEAKPRKVTVAVK